MCLCGHDNTKMFEEIFSPSFARPGNQHKEKQYYSPNPDPPPSPTRLSPVQKHPRRPRCWCHTTRRPLASGRPEAGIRPTAGTRLRGEAKTERFQINRLLTLLLLLLSCLPMLETFVHTSTAAIHAPLPCIKDRRTGTRVRRCYWKREADARDNRQRVPLRHTIRMDGVGEGWLHAGVFPSPPLVNTDFHARPGVAIYLGYLLSNNQPPPPPTTT